MCLLEGHLGIECPWMYSHAFVPNRNGSMKWGLVHHLLLLKLITQVNDAFNMDKFEVEVSIDELCHRFETKLK